MATAKQIAWRKKFVKLYGRKKKKGSRKKSMRTGDLSEECYVKRLKKKLGEKSVVFRTGINASEGVPDIITFSGRGISFYEIKPVGRHVSSLGKSYVTTGVEVRYTDSDIMDQFLRKAQEKWIRENCLERKIKAYIVFYLRTGRKRLKFTYYSKQLTKQNLKKYSQSSPKSTRMAVLDKMDKDYDDGKIHFI